MPSDYHLKIEEPNVPGESKHEKHPGEIDVESFSWGISQPGSASAQGGAGAGKASFSDLSVMASVGKHSPVLAKSAATGTHHKKATLSLRKAGEKQEEFYKVVLFDLLIGSVQHSGSNGGSPLPMESIALNFAKVEFDYSPQKEDGKLDSAVQFKYDLKANKAY